VSRRPFAKYCPVSIALLILTGCSTHGPGQIVPVVQRTSTIALTNATVVDVRTGEQRSPVTLVIAGNRIAAVGPVSTVPIPATSRVVDATGKFLIPGLVDTHVHLFSEWDNPPVDTASYFGWILAGGVTTIREMSVGDGSKAAALRAASDAGQLLAPRIYVSAGPNGRRPDPWAELFERSGSRDIATVLRQFPSLGIDGLKLNQNAPRDTTLALIATARAAGVPVYGHSVFIGPERPFPAIDNFTFDLVRAGLNGVVHSLGTFKPKGVDPGPAPTLPRTTADGRRAWSLYFFTAWQRASERDIQMLIDTMVARGVWYEPTRLNSYYWEHQDQYDVGALSPLHPWRTRDQSRPTDAELRDAVLKSEAAEARFITRFYEAGGIILAGTDEVPFPPFGVAEEMRLLVAAGLPPLAALQAATINAARAMGYDDRVGTLEVGKLADIVLLDADPLKDITNVHKIRAVVHDGRLLDRATLDEFLRRVGTP
jgi:imidazolonepropionase-like amidohydrolase